MLTESDLRAGLTSSRFGQKIYTFETIDSTNNCARALAGCWAAEGTAVIAEQQTAGKGRLGRTWVASAGENLMFSLVLRPRLPVESVQLLPIAAGIAIATAIRTLTSLPACCKWPNDVLVNGRKVAGVLLEAATKLDAIDFVILGMGINVNQTVFPRELEQTATSLRNEGGSEVDRIRLFCEILNHLEQWYDALGTRGPGAVIDPWLELCSGLGKEIAVDQHGQIITGTMNGVGRDGALLVRTPDGMRALYAGDVTILKNDLHASGH